VAGRAPFDIELTMDDGSAKLEHHLKSFTRVPISKLCQSDITVVDPLQLSVFLHNGKKWLTLNKKAIGKIWDLAGARSVCAILKQNLFKLDDRHLNTLAHSLEDEKTADVIGLYRGPSDNYALVVRTPVDFKKEQLAAGLIGGGLGALALPSREVYRYHKMMQDSQDSDAEGYLTVD
jgi:hypothetical protein